MALIRIMKTLFALLLARTPGFVSALWFTGRRRRYDGRVMEAKAQALGELALSLRDPEAPLTAALMREGYREGRKILDTPGPKPALLEDHAIPGPAGDIPIRIYDAAESTLKPSSLRPTLVYLHGGGWVIGDLDTHHGLCTRLAAYSGARVIAVDYRLAPEHVFPAAPDDVRAVHAWLMENGPELGADPERLAFGGDSAGGNLTAVLMHDLAAAGQTMPQAQLMIYPAVEMSMEGKIFDDLEDAYILPPQLCRWFKENYLPPGTSITDPRLSPLYSPHLGGQPPAYIITAGHDVLRPQAELYAEQLRNAGGDVTYEEERGQIHGFINFNAVTPSSDAAIKRMGSWLKSKLG